MEDIAPRLLTADSGSLRHFVERGQMHSMNLQVVEYGV